MLYGYIRDLVWGWLSPGVEATHEIKVRIESKVPSEVKESKMVTRRTEVAYSRSAAGGQTMNGSGVMRRMQSSSSFHLMSEKDRLTRSLGVAISRNEVQSVISILSQVKSEDLRLELLTGSSGGSTLIQTAIANPRILRILLDSISTRAEIAVKSKTTTFAPLHIAALRGDEESTKILIEFGADVNCESKVGELK